MSGQAGQESGPNVWQTVLEGVEGKSGVDCSGFESEVHDFSNGASWKKVGNEWKAFNNGKEFNPTIAKFGDDDETVARKDCGQVGLKSSGPDSGQACKEVFTALSSGNTGQLANALNNWRYEADVEQMKNMNPQDAYNVLKKLGFSAVTLPGGANGVCSVAEWCENFLVAKFEPGTVKSVLSNTKLLAYLDMLSQYVNHNTGVMNGSAGSGSGSGCATKFAKELGIKERIPMKGLQASNDINNLRKYHQFAHPLTVVSRTGANPYFKCSGSSGSGCGISSPFGQNILGVASSKLVVPIAQAGGGVVNTPRYVQTGGDYSVCGAKGMRELSKHVMKLMENNHKTLAPADVATLEQNLDKLGKAETQVLDSINAIAQYNGQISDNIPETVSLNKLKSLVQRHARLQSRYTRHEGSILDVYAKIIAICEGNKGSNWNPLP